MKKIVGLLVVSSLSLFALNSEEVYKNCVMCHGKKSDKIALNSSPRLSTLNEDVLLEKLKRIISNTSTISPRYINMHRTKLKTVEADDVEKFANYVFKLRE